MTNDELKQRFAELVGADIPVRFREMDGLTVAISADLKGGRSLAMFIDGGILDGGARMFRESFVAGPQAS